MAIKTVPKWILVILLTGNRENYYGTWLRLTLNLCIGVLETDSFY